MTTKLYVANLPSAASASALRAHFSACGVVVDLELVPERNAGRGRGSAFVRMGSPAGAARALAKLNGAPFGGQLLVVEAAPDDPVDRRDRPRRGASPRDDDTGVRITLQFREPTNMTYELDCSDVKLVVRVFFPDALGQCRVVAQVAPESDEPISAATAPSRIEALRGVARACRETVGATALGHVDWDAVEQALLKVRAV